jgi:soluble lytic murein transglycosylase-like protein
MSSAPDRAVMKAPGAVMAMHSNPEDQTPTLTAGTMVDAATAMKMLGSLAHGMILGLFLVIAGLGAMLVSHGKERDALEYQVAQLQQEKADLSMQNEHLRELTIPVKKKIDRAASYIHIRHKLPIAEATVKARSEMVNSLRTNIPFNVGLAVTERESGFRSNVVSPNGCCLGEKQLHLRYRQLEYPGLTRAELFDTQVNIAIGYDVLRRYTNESNGSLYGGLMRYSGNVEPGYNEAYATDVLARSQRIARALQT